MVYLTVENSLNLSIDRIVKRYSSLFELPSCKKALLLLALSCLGGGTLTTIAFSSPLEALIDGLLLGSSVFFVSLIFDYVVGMLILRQDPIYDLRRTVVLSLSSLALWFFFIFVGVAVAMLFTARSLSWLVRLSLLGFSAVIIFRLVVFNSTSSMDYRRLIAASILQPSSCAIPFVVVWSSTGYSINFHILLFFSFSIAVGLLSSFLFLTLLNRVGEQTLGIPSLSLFKAFLLNWIVGLNAPFEEILEKLGEDKNVRISLIKFGVAKPQAVIIVPSIHPGPFKNIGSSLLPSMLKTAVEKELNCIVCVPHGLLGHEFDLTSQFQNHKIINRVVESMDFEASEAEATPFIKVRKGLATACAQVFGRFALLSFTLAPETTEDLPQELGRYVLEEAEKCGLTDCAIVNAHNSVNGLMDMERALPALKAAAANCLEQIVSLERLPFQVGAATVTPKEFNLKDGMGPGGITVTVVKVGEQKTAYVVIDGNNMVCGLREKILSALQSIGIDEGEIFTTDTHSVNALVLDERGYHPIGEAIDNEKLISYVKEITLAAVSDLKRAKTATHSITVPNVKVIGDRRLEALCLLTDRVLEKAKKTVIPLFAVTGLLLMLFLMFV